MRNGNSKGIVVASKAVPTKKERLDMHAGLNATGVTLRLRSTGLEFGVHQRCYDALMAELPPEATDPFTGELSTMGPLFAPHTEWECSYRSCA